MEFLKDILGEELYNQVESKISASDKKVKLINGADGSYVPKVKFDQVNDQKKELQQQVDTLKDISTKYEDLQADVGNWKDQADKVPALKKKMEEWETKATGLEGELTTSKEQIDAFAETETKYKEELRNTQINSAIEKQLTLSNAKYPDLVFSKFDRTKIEIAEDGTIQGIDEQLKGFKETYKEMFGQDKMTGGSPNTGGGNPSPDGKAKLEELAKKARESGRVEDRIAYAKAKAEVN